MVQSVTVPGTALAVQLATQAGQPYDMRTVERDVRYLWSLGRFEDIRVESAGDGGQGVSLVFHTTPKQFFRIREVHLEPHTFGVELTLPEGTRLDRERAYGVALDAEKNLQERGFPNAQVAYQVTPAPRGQFDLKLKIDPGDALRVTGVAFTGDTGIPAAKRAMWQRRSRSTCCPFSMATAGWFRNCR